MVTRQSGPVLPPRYRSLLRAYPASWRREHEEDILGILMEVHAAQGRSRPSTTERLQFGVAGSLVRFHESLRRREPRRFADVATLARFHAFDQQNGLDPNPRPLTESEQLRANASGGRQDGKLMSQVSWGPIAFRG